MTTNRHLSDVIDELIAAEPELSKLLHSSRNRALYCAPEMMMHVWNDVARLLSEAYPDRVDLQAIYNGTRDPESNSPVDGGVSNSPTTER